MDLIVSGTQGGTQQRAEHRGACVRAYQRNSPKAMARVLAVTLLADGTLEARELESLARSNAWARLGMTEADFMRVVEDFCEDLLTHAPRSGDGHFHLDPALMNRMLAEITDAWCRRELIRLMIEVIRADGRVARGESVMFWQALDAWGMTLSDVMAMPRRTKPEIDETADLRPGPWRRRLMAGQTRVLRA